MFPHMNSNTETPLKDVISQVESTTLASPIPYLTPLASRVEIHSTEVVNVEDLTPIGIRAGSFRNQFNH